MSLRLIPLAAAALSVLTNIARGDELLTFEQHVRPILKSHCFQCHGEEHEIEASLDLRQARRMTKGGDSGPAIVAGNASESLLLQRLTAGEMPPEGKGKPLTADQIATIRSWIDQGAKTARPEAEQPTEVSDDDRAFWSFQPLASPPLPFGEGGERSSPSEGVLFRTAIDVFLLAELKKNNLSLSHEADRATLIRRAAFDLSGLPPLPDEVAAFTADSSPDAFERLLDRLLASPRYGERWGRHWLDVAGYADSDGYTEKDPERKYAFKYRDYVVRSLNADKPWNQFLVEQLAGDELLTPPYTNLSPEQADLLAATGFLRMAPDGTADGGVDQSAACNDCLAETIKIVSSSILGLTVGCAQCHNHRYDAIPQADYYRFRAIFEPALDVKSWRKPAERLVSLWSDEIRQQAAAIDADLKKLADERQSEMDRIVADIFDAEIAKLPEEQRDLARQARDTAVKDRTDEHKQILNDYPSLNVSRGSAYLYERKRVDALNKDFDARQKDLQAKRPTEDFVPCLTEVPGQLPQTFIFFRGDITQPRQEVQPAELSVLAACDHKSPIPNPQSQIPPDDPSLPTSGRRLGYARWLTSGDHPLVPRVLVNRIWLLHFGRGIVATPADFGVLGERPSHPNLLDWMARNFMKSGWELKRLHRQLMSSTAYRQSSVRSDALDAIDPDNRLLGRMSIRRLEAESVRDAILAASGNLNSKMLGPPAPVTVDEVGQVIVGLDNRDSAGRPVGKRGVLGGDEFRRSVYVQVRRSKPLSMLETFDAPALNPNCELRVRSTVAPQSLLLMNNEFVLSQAQALAQRVTTECLASAGVADRRAQIQLAWRLALSRDPSPSEIDAALALVADQERDSSEAISGSAESAPQPLAIFCQALFSASAFLYVD